MERKNLIIRDIYMKQIRPYICKDIIKILIGQRRVGKSCILRAISDEIRCKYPEANIIDINLEDFAFSHIDTAEKLHHEIISRIEDDKRNFIFLDEVQEVSDFDKVVRSLILDTNNDVYLTGSNSGMLSSEIASRLAGRSITIHVHPLTYAEFINFHHLEENDDTLTTYMRYGGLPYLVNLPDRSTWSEYISGVTDAVVYRDVVSRHSLRNNDFLKRLLLFLADNVGMIFTAKNIADYLKSQRISSSVTSVQAYVNHVQDAFIINCARRWDIIGKRYFEIGEKIFFEDLGIRNSIVGFRPGDIAKLMENVVYNHLIACGFSVKIGMMSQGKEIDFVAERENELRYIQVAVNTDDYKTALREFGNLGLIPDNYEKTVVTLRDSTPNSFNGIRQVSLRDFLLNTH